MRFQGLPERIPVIPSRNIHIQTAAALQLLSANKARQVFDSNGEFLGVELGHFGPARTCGHAEILPAAELPGLTFADPNPAHNYHKFVMAYLA